MVHFSVVRVALLAIGVALSRTHAAESLADSSSSALYDAVAETTDAPKAVTTPPQPLSTALNWGACSIPTTAVTTGGFLCATVTLPMCYEGDGLTCGKGASLTHSLKMLRRGGDGSSTKPTVWFVTDSNSAQQTAQLMYEVSQNDTMQVFGLQLRPWNYPLGTADTKTEAQIPCSELYAASRAHSQVNTSTIDAARSCSGWLTETFGVNGINAFSLDTAAKDLTRTMSLVQKLEPSTTKSGVYVLSSGKASRVVQRFMAQNEDSKDAPVVSGYVFDTPHPMKLSATQDKIVGGAIDRLVGSCDSDAFCKSKFANISTTMADVLKATYSAVDGSRVLTSPCLISLKDASYDTTRDLKPSHGTRRFFASLDKQDTPGLRLLAPLLYRLHRCTSDDATKLISLFEEIKKGKFRVQPMAEFVDRTITFSEFWPSPPPSREQLTETFESTLVSDGAMSLQQPSYCVHTGGSPAGCSALYKRDSEIDSKVVLTYKAASVSSKSVSATTGLVGSSTADVLILTSRLSLSGSMEVSEQLYESFGSGVSQRVLIQSDNVAGDSSFGERMVGTELSGSERARLMQVVGLFVTKKAKALNGKWYIRDLAAFDFANQRGSLTSTYGAAPVSVNFNPDTDEVAGWSAFRRRQDLYETGTRPWGRGYSSSDSCTGSDCSNIKTTNVIKAGLAGIAVGLIIGGSSLVLCLCLGFFLARRFLSGRRQQDGGLHDQNSASHAYPAYDQGPANQSMAMHQPMPVQASQGYPGAAYHSQQQYQPQHFQQPHDPFQQHYQQPMPQSMGQPNWNPAAPVVRSSPNGVI